MNGRLAMPEFGTPIVDDSIRSALLDAVDYALLALGEIPRETMYECIEERYQIRRDEIPEKFGMFHAALQGLLGGGAESVKRLIMKRFCSRLGVTFDEREGWTSILKRYFP
jgi:hypothetical protein